MTKAEVQEEDFVLKNVQQGHAYQHYKSSMHVYAMEIDSKKVWDFSRENYVYRLIQNGLDGKLMEINQPGEQEDKEVNLDSIFRYNKKVESLNHEYNTILVKTLEN